MQQARHAMQLAGATLERHYHVCAFFHSRDEEYRVLGPFVKEGLDWGEKALHITDPELRDDHLRRLEAAGIAVDERRGGQLEVRTWDEAYLCDGRFQVDAMLGQLDEVLRTSKVEGFSRTRIIGHMEWALEDRPGVDQLLEYEARVNDVLAKHQGPAVCVYDLARFRSDVIVDIMRTHPMVIMGGTLRENPFFEQPDVFLRELRERQA